MNEIVKNRLLERIEETEHTGSVKEMSEMFREYIIEQDRLQEEMYLDFERRAKEYVYLIDDYRTAVCRYKRRYKRLKISYITLFIAVFFAVLYYLFVEKYGLLDIKLTGIFNIFG